MNLYTPLLNLYAFEIMNVLKSRWHRSSITERQSGVDATARHFLVKLCYCRHTKLQVERKTFGACSFDTPVKVVMGIFEHCWMFR